jgi:EmrB/QacA subfamily drug resistance transporter
MEAAKIKKLGVLTVGLGLFMAMLDTTIVTISIPAMMKDFNTSTSNIAWVLDAYLLVLAMLILVMGRLADQYGRRLLYGIGVGIFTVGSLLCAVSWDVGCLVGFRCFQAIGAAIMIPTTMAIITAMFPPEKRGMAMGLWAAIGITAAAVGPTLGGILIEYLDWSWIFYVNLPIGVVALALIRRAVPESRDSQASKKVDYVGVVTSSISIFSLVLAITKGADWGWTSALTVTLFILATEFMIAFLLFEKMQSKPMMDLGLFKSVTFSSSVLGQCLVAVGMLGAMYLLTLFLQNVLGYSALKAALSVTPIPLTALVLAPVTGKICDKIGGRPVTVLGVIALVVGLYLCSQLGADSGLGDIAWRAVIIGVGFGLSNVGLAAASMGAVKAGEEGVGSGVLNMSRMIGMALGVAVCVALLANYATAPMNEAKTEIATIIMADQQLPAALKGQIAEKLAALGEQKGPQAIPDLEAVAIEMGAPEAVLPHIQELSAQVKTIVRTNMSRAFSDVDEVVAIACSFGILPALLLGKPKKRAGGEPAAVYAGMG